MSENDIWSGLSDEDFLSIREDLLVTVAAKRTSSASSTSQVAVFNGKRRMIKQIPLYKYRYGRLFVSDFSTQLWCEQQMVFSHEPPSQLKREEIIERPEIAVGSSLHLARELEIQDAVEIKVTSKEDRFAIKVINLLDSVMCLLSGVATVRREVPVFGVPFEGNVFVSGVIDELRCCDATKMDLEIVEFKTRVTNEMPLEAQAKTHNLQVMLYKKLLDDLISQKLTKYAIAKHLGLNLHKPFGKHVATHAKPFKAQSLDRLLDTLFETVQAVPFASSLLVEYAFQGDGSTIGIRQVTYDDAWLRYQVNWCLEFWTGQREEPAGVEIEDAWKCKRCPYHAYCSPYARLGDQFDKPMSDCSPVEAGQ